MAGDNGDIGMATDSIEASARLRAVLFDAAGTLIRLREPVGATYARLAQRFGVRVDPARLTAAFAAVFRRMPAMVFPGESAAAVAAHERGWWHAMVAAVFRSAAPTARFSDFESFFDALFRFYQEPTAWLAVPHAHAVLTALHQRGLRVGMVSNFDHRLPTLLEGLGLAPLLEVVVRPADAGAAKPDARIFAVALARLAVAPGEALYVGDDAEHDIAGARAAGLRALDVAELADLRGVLRSVAAAPEPG